MKNSKKISFAFKPIFLLMFLFAAGMRKVKKCPGKGYVAHIINSAIHLCKQKVSSIVVENHITSHRNCLSFFKSLVKKSLVWNIEILVFLNPETWDNSTSWKCADNHQLCYYQETRKEKLWLALCSLLPTPSFPFHRSEYILEPIRDN